MKLNFKIVVMMAVASIIFGTHSASAKFPHIHKVKIHKVHIPKIPVKAAVPAINPGVVYKNLANTASVATTAVGNAISAESHALCVGAIKGSAGAIVGLQCVPAMMAIFAECETAAGGPEDPAAAVCPAAPAGVKIVCGAAAGAIFTTSLIQPLVEKVCGK
jgi:hypothetical protein